MMEEDGGEGVPRHHHCSSRWRPLRGCPPDPTEGAGCATSKGDDTNPSVPLRAGFLAASWGLMGALEPS